ncbi:hypothetical protein FRC07_006238 [Ceratobasidium sp. 392]|nr:hypothetical protein FRC07_006238 [Ceratobasidium sp. 392]
MGVTHNRLVEAVKQKQIYAEQASEDDDEDERASVYHLEEVPDEPTKGSTPPALKMKNQVIEMNEEWTYDSTPSMLDDAHMTSSEEPESSEQTEQFSSRIQIDRCVYSAEKTNGYYYCLWCGTPETPSRRYRRCKRWQQELLLRHQSSLGDQEDADV